MDLHSSYVIIIAVFTFLLFFCKQLVECINACLLTVQLCTNNSCICPEIFSCGNCNLTYSKKEILYVICVSTTVLFSLRRERLAAHGVAAQPGQVGGFQCQHAAVAIDFDAAPPGARVLGLHHLAAAAVELGRADERVHLNVCATRHLAEAASPRIVPVGAAAYRAYRDPGIRNRS